MTYKMAVSARLCLQKQPPDAHEEGKNAGRENAEAISSVVIFRSHSRQNWY